MEEKGAEKEDKGERGKKQAEIQRVVSEREKGRVTREIDYFYSRTLNILNFTRYIYLLQNNVLYDAFRAKKMNF